MKVQQSVEKGWCNEYAATTNLECNEIFSRVLPENMKNFAQTRPVKHKSIVMEPSIPFHTLVNFVEAEGITNGKNRTLDLPLKINTIISKL